MLEPSLYDRSQTATPRNTNAVAADPATNVTDAAESAYQVAVTQLARAAQRTNYTAPMSADTITIEANERQNARTPERQGHDRQRGQQLGARAGDAGSWANIRVRVTGQMGRRTRSGGSPTSG